MAVWARSYSLPLVPGQCCRCAFAVPPWAMGKALFRWRPELWGSGGRLGLCRFLIVNDGFCSVGRPTGDGLFFAFIGVLRIGRAAFKGRAGGYGNNRVWAFVGRRFRNGDCCTPFQSALRGRCVAPFGRGIVALIRRRLLVAFSLVGIGGLVCAVFLPLVSSSPLRSHLAGGKALGIGALTASGLTIGDGNLRLGL